MKVKVLLFGIACAYALSVAIAQTVPSLPDAQAPALTDLFMVDQRTGATATGWQSRKITGPALLKELPPTIETAANTSELESVSVADAPSIGSIYRLGFSTLGDAPPLLFIWNATWNGTPDNLGYAIAPNGAASCSSGCWVANGSANDFDILEFAGNTAKDYGAPCSAAMSLLPSTIGGTIRFPGGITYPFTTQCTIPMTLTEGSVVNVMMFGSKLTTSTAIHIFDRTPSNQTSALDNIDTVNFYGGSLNGNGTNGQIGINLASDFGGRLIGTHFYNFDSGFYCRFCLNYRVENSLAGGNISYAYALDIGNWSGANSNNSQSNDSTIVSSDDEARSGQIASYYVSGSDGVRLEDVISEGSNPAQMVLFNDQGSTTVKHFIVSNLHAESNPSDALITIIGAAGGETFDISHVFTQYISPLLDTTSAAEDIFDVSDIPYFIWGTSNIAFKGEGGNGSRWNFTNISADVTNPAIWSGLTPFVSVFSMNGAPTNMPPGLNYKTMAFGENNDHNAVSQHYDSFFWLNDDVYTIGGSVSTYRPHAVYAGSGGFGANGSLGVTCPAGTINPATETVVGGIITHC